MSSNSESLDLSYNLLESQSQQKHPWFLRLNLISLTPTERSLFVVGGINLLYVVLQLIVAEKTGSLAMLSDAFHNLSDVGAAWVAFQCERLRHQEAAQYPFGYLRLQVLGALVNSICLVSLALYLVLSALPLIFNPSEDGFHPSIPFVCVAAVGVFINLMSSFLLCCGGKDAQGNPNFTHAHVGCSCPHPSSESEVCLDGCCTPEVMDDAALQVPFGFVKAKSSPKPLSAIHDESKPLGTITSAPTTLPLSHSSSRISRIRNVLKVKELDENVMAVMVHSAGDACSSLVVFIVGLLVLCFGDEGSWVDYLDPTVTIVLSVAMALAVWGILKKSTTLLLEASSFSAIEVSEIKDTFLKDPVLVQYGVSSVAELIVTDLDFDGSSRRASLILVTSNIASSLSSLGHTIIRQRAKSILKLKGVKWAVVEIRVPGESELIGMDEKQKPHDL